MKRFRNVLAYPSGLNLGDPAVSTAADLARRTGARVTVVWILDPSSSALDAKKQSRREKLLELTDELNESGVSAASRLLEGGKPSKVLVDQVRKHDFDLIVKTARPGDQDRDRAFSETAKRLLRTSPCPVWIVRTSPPDSPTKILAAISPYHHQEESRELDRVVLQVAAQLGQARDAQLAIASAWQPVAADGVLSKAQREEFLSEREGVARKNLRGFLTANGHTVPDDDIHFRLGNPAEVIAEIAQEINAELIVVGVAQRSTIKRWIVGSTAEDVLDDGATDIIGVGKPSSDS